MHSEPAEQANFVAARVVADAAAFLDGRHGAEQLASNAEDALIQLLPFGDDSASRPIVIAARLLQVAMACCARANDVDRISRWMAVMFAMIDLVRHESNELRRTGAQRS